MEVASSREGEDFYYIQLNYRPFGGFDGAPGVEEFITDKSGDIKFRQVLLEPDPEKKAPEQKKEQTQGT